MQIGADDALVAFHALRAIQRDAGAAARIRWQMNGFNRSPGATAHPMTTRNLIGQVDGTRNPKPAEADFAERIFVPEEPQAGNRTPAWMANGSYVVVRRIRMLLDDWEKLSLKAQEDVIGRRKSDGAPLSGGSDATETTEMDLEKTDGSRKLVVPINAHARITLSRPERRRGHGPPALLVPRRLRRQRRPGRRTALHLLAGRSAARLRARAAQAGPGRRAVPVHPARGGALFAVPGGASEGGYVGQRLLEGRTGDASPPGGARRDAWAGCPPGPLG
ncbi:Deferrochelatase OS=Streptomyces tendae OX=1932 GN=efeB PE=3 SV=1 [Streptomyces tendae]